MPETVRELPAIVKGWMSDAEKSWLAEQARTRQAIAEVGCWMGVTTCVLADAAPHGTIYAVDTWEGSAEHQQLLAGRPAGFLFEKFIEQVGARTNVHPLPLESQKAAALLYDSGVKLDMVFIDAAHDYENVKADILAWRKVLSPGGLLCGHDFDAGQPGVVRAVRELVSDIKRAAGSIWYAC